MVFLFVAFAVLPLAIRNRRATSKLTIIAIGILPGLTLCALLALPWFLFLFERLPDAYSYMVGNQAGHALDASSKNRSGPIYFFVPVLLPGFMPWTLLLGWLWRKSHWQQPQERYRRVPACRRPRGRSVGP